MSNNLYLRYQGRISGPFPFEKIQEMLKRGQISRLHQISPDRATWTRVAENEMLVPPAPVEPVAAAVAPQERLEEVPPVMAGSTVRANPARAMQREDREAIDELAGAMASARKKRCEMPGNSGLFAAYAILYWVNILLLIACPFVLVAGGVALSGLQSKSSAESAAASLGVGFLVFLICIPATKILAIIFHFGLLYQAWELVQDEETAQTTPGKAVGFMFIPFFNLGWVFVAYGGLSKSMNAYIAKHRLKVRPLGSGLQIGYAVLLILMCIPILNVLVAIPFLIVEFLAVSAFTKKANEILVCPRPAIDWAQVGQVGVAAPASSRLTNAAYCRGCGREIHATAQTCPHCGAPQKAQDQD